MKSSNITPQEMKGYYTNDKITKLKEVSFQWKVDVTDIHKLRPNFEIGSLVGRNLQ